MLKIKRYILLANVSWGRDQMLLSPGTGIDSVACFQD